MAESTNPAEPSGVIVTASLTPPGPATSTVLVQQPASDDNTMGLIIKMATAVLAAPAISTWLAAHGIVIDPTMASLLIAGALHKVHQILKQSTGWTWL